VARAWAFRGQRGALRGAGAGATQGLNDPLGSHTIPAVMGLAKKLMMEQDEQGWSFTDDWVCHECVNDHALRAVIEANARPEASCTFCKTAVAAPLDVLLEAFVNGLETEYEDAIEGVSWDGREGGFQWDPKWETWELVSQFEDVLTGPGLLDAVIVSMHERTWVEYNFAAPRVDQALMWGWREFCHAIKYETRYVFWLRKHEDDSRYGAGEVPAARVLEEIGRLVESLGLVRPLPARSRFARSRRSSEDTSSWGATDLGTTPVNSSKSSRMSPAGIPMFYGARDAATAIAEVGQAATTERIVYGWFETSRRCEVVDFTHLGEPPSMFDGERASLRRPLLFLNAFVEEMREPSRKELAEINYVPTQVVTEYLLRILGADSDIAGLVYPSSITNEDCIVLDIPNSRCVPQQVGWDERDELVLGFDGEVLEAEGSS
jgi:RES domain-containing protein